MGADLMAGSLIKNPGSGLAPMGGYVAGRADLVEYAAERLSVPGIGSECGASLGVNRSLFQGFFFAPHTVSQALKTMAFAAGMLSALGFETSPAADERRADIIQDDVKKSLVGFFNADLFGEEDTVHQVAQAGKRQLFGLGDYCSVGNHVLPDHAAERFYDVDAVVAVYDGIPEAGLVPPVEFRSEGFGNPRFPEKLLKPTHQDFRLGDFVILQPPPEGIVDPGTKNAHQYIWG